MTGSVSSDVPNDGSIIVMNEHLACLINVRRVVMNALQALGDDQEKGVREQKRVVLGC
jgi:hypothetical protein